MHRVTGLRTTSDSTSRLNLHQSGFCSHCLWPVRNEITELTPDKCQSLLSMKLHTPPDETDKKKEGKRISCHLDAPRNSTDNSGKSSSSSTTKVKIASNLNCMPILSLQFLTAARSLPDARSVLLPRFLGTEIENCELPPILRTIFAVSWWR